MNKRLMVNGSKVFFAVVALICGSLPMRGVAQDALLKGFKALAVPRESVPVGAEWINGLGPNGGGVSEDNIKVTQSLSEASFDRVFKQSLDAGILQYFRLSQNADKVSHIKYNDITVHTVADITKVNLVSGQAVIYEFLKAGKISIDTTQGLGATLKAKFDDKLADLKVDVSASDGARVTMSGQNLVLAFRVFQLGKSRSQRDSAKIKLNKDDSYPRAVRVLDYEVSINPQDFVDGVLAGGAINRSFSKTDWSNCRESYPFKVTLSNTAKMNSSGQIFRKTFEQRNGDVKTYQIANRQAQGLVTDIITVGFGYELPTGGLMYLYDVVSGSKVNVERITTPLQMMPNPQAPGW